MPQKQDIIELTEKEPLELEDIVRKGTHQARVIRRAQTLLWSDAGKQTLKSLSCMKFTL